MSGWGAVAQIGSQIASEGLSAYFTSKEARKQRDWQEKMYKRRFRYSMADMRAAGLNPILAAGMGLGGAGGPGSGAAASAKAQSGSAGQVINQSALVAGQLEQLAAATSAQAADAELKRAQTKLARAQMPAAAARASLYSDPNLARYLATMNESPSNVTRLGGGIGGIFQELRDWFTNPQPSWSARRGSMTDRSKRGNARKSDRRTPIHVSPQGWR